ncbi:MAG TPA: outer membrane beta-barrel protein [Gammaproteobacteria bacterium]|nr:outer membrane beta-barrel protein [Gammaproteobacteria bacterium]HQZ88353.1 outer membrane beta-barrel protein [Gammaproteobacteria bacterium]HRA43285.1 outer membrane beta-barrel protein [Gammaproteobacteria bacterium]
MSHLKGFILLAALFVTSSAFAEDGMYVSLGAGLGKVSKVKSNQDFPLVLKSPGVFATPITEMTLDFKNAIRINGAIGYKTGDFRVEFEPSYLKAKYKKIDQKPYPLIAAKDLSGYVRSLSGFMNGYYDFPVSDTLVPYVGAGLGYTRIKNHLEHAGLVDFNGGGQAVNLPTLKFNMSDNSLAYQAIAGFMVNLTNQFALTVDYRFSSTTKKMLAFNDKLKSHVATLGLMYKF